ncbi:Protein PLANT CADMIUM RESISTANCE 8 [Rhynchospora pubera]|uniref:Protein PLANT CADMIUM RESISTANCE 8 n=1 Tax=Rhynchospora pubera TaxID=906938 RepID=A0AAV8EGY1_9POAL|nr:Protein PLANT CADMIUM RESISTANCE 8 [Rhynchospora pubera]
MRGMSRSSGFLFRVPFVRKIDWNSVISECKNWCMHPMNMALLVWFFFVAAGVFLLLLLLTGALNGVITKNSLRKRPDWAVNLCMGIGLAAPIIAGLYMIYGPLGKKYTMPDPKLDDDLESQVLQSDPKLILTRPVWIGGLFNFWDDLTVACSSLFCTCCVFGWNMERLGFGNMYVHIFTFLLLCIAPFWVFNVSALMINDEALRYSVGLSDFVRWLFCSPCSLAQEVRTGNFYEVEEGGLCLKEKKEEETEEMKLELAPLERERNTATVPEVPVLVQIAECGMSEKT